MASDGTIKIGGHTYVVKELDVMESFCLQPILLPVVGRALGVIVTVLDPSELTSLEAAAAVIATLDTPEGLARILPRAPGLLAELGRVAAEVSPANLKLLLRQLLGTATRDEVPLFLQGELPFNEVMRGQTVVIWRLLIHAVKINYPDFFGALGGSVGTSPAQSPSEGSSTSPPPGPSGG